MNPQHPLEPGHVGPGSIIEGRYRLDAQLGAGGMGTVYSGRHTALDRQVAVKVLHPHVATAPGAADRFLREAKILAKLNHPGAVEVYDFGNAQGVLYIAMELLSGMPLDVLAVNPVGGIDLARAVKLCVQTLDVLTVAHGLGIVHRDLKPGNLFVESPGQDHEKIKVVDFGLAYLEDAPGQSRLTEVGMVHGTPEYMAPEQCLGQLVDGRADLYAVGCVLWELITGLPPFGIGQAIQIMTSQVYKPLPVLAEVAPEFPVPPAVEAVLLRALAKRAEDRFPDAAAMKDDLLAAINAPDEELRGAGKAHRREQPKESNAEARGSGTVGLWQTGKEAPTGGPGIAEALGSAGFFLERVTNERIPDHLGALVIVPSPGQDGIDIATRWAARPGAPPILLCGTDDLTLMTRAIEVGVHDYVVLPLDAADLVKKVARAVKKRTTRRAAGAA